MNGGPNVRELPVHTIFWNINGRARFLNDSNIFAWLNQYDIIFISETHFARGQIFNLPGFRSFHNSNCIATNLRISYGGISCFIKSRLFAFINSVDTSFTNHIVIYFKNNHRLFGSYIPPIDSFYYDPDFHHQIPLFFNKAESHYAIIGAGDFNSRVGNISQKLPKGWHYHDNIDTVRNTHGNLLLQMSSKHKFYVLNNLNINEQCFTGDYTFEKGGRKSQIDLCLANQAGIRSIDTFQIHDIPFNFSDHKPISILCSINLEPFDILNQVSHDLLTGPVTEFVKRAPKVENVNWEAYTKTASINLDIYTKSNLSDHSNIDSFNKTINDLSDILYSSAKSCSNPIPKKENNTSIHTQEHRSIHNIASQLYTDNNTKWKNILNSNDPKALWNNISYNEPNSDNITYPSAKEIGTHFKNKSTLNDTRFLRNNAVNTYVPVLDNPITQSELSEATNQLKEDKSTSDGWNPKMISSIPGVLFPIFLNLFNTHFFSTFFPVRWCLSVIIAIFKNKGSQSSPQNYRPISLVTMLSKLFDFILLNRFRKWFIPHDCQTAYQNGKSCADHIFTLRALVNHCVKNKQKLFVICIDFEGAFDKVSRHTLFNKLKLFGAGSSFIASLISMYLVTDYVIFQNNTSFTYHLFAGIKQGLPLSPWLFLFYINDIFDLFYAIYGQRSLLDTLHVLIHADDTTITATSRSSAEQKIKTLLYFCELNSISLQYKKCEFIVINGNEHDKLNFTIGSKSIKNVEYISLLGSHMSQSGKLNADLKLHMQKRYLAIHKFYNFLRSNKMAPVCVKLKVLRACVISSLLHNCETFADKIPDGLENYYFQMIKACLSVRNSTPNKLVLVESGMPTLKSMIISRQLNFINKYVKSMIPDSPRSSVYQLLVNANNTYIQHYQQLNYTYSSSKDVTRFYLEQNLKAIETFANNNKYKYMQYMKFNPELSPPDLTHPYSYKFCRLRLSSHTFPIETGRWKRIDRQLRVCETCNVLGDEEHYIYTCVEIDRNNLVIPPIENLSNYKELQKLLHSLNHYL